MIFEFDPNKSASNKRKHGIDFVEAQALWVDADRIVFPALTVDEERFILIAMWNQVYWSAIYTVRDKRTRIISVRRSRREEVALYEGQGSR